MKSNVSRRRNEKATITHKSASTPSINANYANSLLMQLYCADQFRSSYSSITCLMIIVQMDLIGCHHNNSNNIVKPVHCCSFPHYYDKTNKRKQKKTLHSFCIFTSFFCVTIILLATIKLFVKSMSQLAYSRTQQICFHFHHIHPWLCSSQLSLLMCPTIKPTASFTCELRAIVTFNVARRLLEPWRAVKHYMVLLME